MIGDSGDCDLHAMVPGKQTLNKSDSQILLFTENKASIMIDRCPNEQKSGDSSHPFGDVYCCLYLQFYLAVGIRPNFENYLA